MDICNSNPIPSTPAVFIFFFYPFVPCLLRTTILHVHASIGRRNENIHHIHIAIILSLLIAECSALLHTDVALAVWAPQSKSIDFSPSAFSVNVWAFWVHVSAGVWFVCWSAQSQPASNRSLGACKRMACEQSTNGQQRLLRRRRRRR